MDFLQAFDKGCEVLGFSLRNRCLRETARRVAIRERDADVQNAAYANKEWKKMDLKAQAFIVKYMGLGELTQIRKCDFAYQIGDVLKIYYSLQSNAHEACP